MQDCAKRGHFLGASAPPSKIQKKADVVTFQQTTFQRPMDQKQQMTYNNLPRHSWNICQPNRFAPRTPGNKYSQMKQAFKDNYIQRMPQMNNGWLSFPQSIPPSFQHTSSNFGVTPPFLTKPRNGSTRFAGHTVIFPNNIQNGLTTKTPIEEETIKDIEISKNKSVPSSESVVDTKIANENPGILISNVQTVPEEKCTNTTNEENNQTNEVSSSSPSSSSSSNEETNSSLKNTIIEANEQAVKYLSEISWVPIPSLETDERGSQERISNLQCSTSNISRTRSEESLGTESPISHFSSSDGIDRSIFRLVHSFPQLYCSDDPSFETVFIKLFADTVCERGKNCMNNTNLSECHSNVYFVVK